MKYRATYLQRTAVFTLSLATLFGAVCWRPALGFGQETADKNGSRPVGTEKPAAEPAGDPPKAIGAKIEKKAAGQTEKTRAGTPGNPVQLPASEGNTDADPVGDAVLSHNFGDYTRAANGVQKPAAKSLPLFGYEIFRSARETVDAQRRFLRRQSVADLPDRSRRNGDDPGSSRSDNSSDTGDGDTIPNDAAQKPASRRKPIAPPTDGSNDRTNDKGSRVDPNSPDADNRDTTDASTAPVKRRPAKTRRPANPDDYDTRDDPYYDNSSSSRPNSRRRDSTDPEADQQNAFTTPVGPIGLLYRGIAASVPANYQIASGDELKIRIESPTLEPYSNKKVVDSRGQIQLENVGNVVVRGQTIESAEKALEIRLRPFYKGVRVSIETGRLRTMQIFVTGEAYEPGSYSVPAAASAFNLLSIAGGPTDNGSLRSVEVRRQGRTVATLDIYKMLVGDGQLSDIPLVAGDVIVIPPRKSRVTLIGEVLRPAVYELLPNETLKDAFRFSGGAKASGLNQSIRINTVRPGAERIIKDVNISSTEYEHQPLFDGDQVEVYSLRNRLSNRVTIEGAVDQPNDYAFETGMRIADLLDHARGPLTEAYLQKAELHRWQPDNTDRLIIVDLERALAKDPKNNLELQQWDRLKVYTREEVAWTGRRKIIVDGAVKKPGVYDVSKGMRVSDLLRMAGGPTPDAELEKAHLFHHHDDGPDTHEYVNVAAAVKGDTNRDAEVFDSDKLVLFTVAQAEFTPDHRVDIKGEVVNPGRYPRFAGMHVSDLLLLAGGFKPSATNSVVLAHARRVADSTGTRVVTIGFDAQHRCAPADDALLEDGDVVSIQAQGGYEPEVQSFIVRGAVNKPGLIVLKSKDMRLSDAIREAGGLRPEAFPQGAQFYRDPQMLATTGQRSLVANLASLNDLLNDSETKREMAKAQLELVKATGKAVEESSPLAGFGGAAPVNPAAGAVAGSISGSQLVSPARKLTNGQLDPNGFIAINLPDALTRPKSADDIILVDGDTVVVPEKPTTVQVVGAVNSSRGILFAPGRQLTYYVDLAGGFAPDASTDRIEIFHMGGGVIPAKRVKELQPGDIVFVPTKVLAAKFSNRGNGFDSIFRSLTSSAIMFKLATGIFGL